MTKKFARKATDMFEGSAIKYPPPPDETHAKYDFHFTKKRKWYYVNSFDKLTQVDVKKQKRLIISKGEKWRIVVAKTGEIVQSSDEDQ